ncbi:hypothetical protein HYH02_002681 [Chlamydomonas schloesseri]|uniref:Expansin-like EG45 domain-containing protein n=1 Tax=Chlamydomonas schloesseri TaxID=2026947 RepID=A0A836BAG6_9CHLO|nr:hypothetical protein HYH02_002681 [Chlamydomonas schloesseri]|eukprot:KAG2452438.1 hypothetical protein HYH02_002681 [Chlamydomonas schloesseri]
MDASSNRPAAASAPPSSSVRASRCKQRARCRRGGAASAASGAATGACGPAARPPASPPAAAAAAAAAGRLPVRRMCLASVALLVLVLLPRDAQGDWDGWTVGRATYYGNDGGATIDQGSCMYGSLPNGMVSTGQDIAALSDTDPSFGGSCGRCYEVTCNPASFNDGYGQWLDRSGACYSGASVVVTITDSCPCNYPNNAYSNKRWCCGDMRHMDLSYIAFGKIANLNQGVIGIKYRQVSCPGYSAPTPRQNSWDFWQGGSSSSSSSSSWSQN